MSLGMQLTLPNISHQIPEHGPASILSRLMSLQNICTLPQIFKHIIYHKKLQTPQKHKKECSVPLCSADQYFIYSSMYPTAANPSDCKISYTMSEKPFHDWGEYGSPSTAFT